MKNILPIFALILVQTPAFAAETLAKANVSTVETTSYESEASSPTRYFRMRAGVNLAKLAISGSSEAESSQKAASGVTIGIGYELPMTHHISFLPELNYGQKGFAYGYRDDWGSLDITAHINYLQVPMLMKAGFESGDLQPYFVAGPYAAVKVGTHATIDKKTGVYTALSMDDANGRVTGVKTFDFGVIGGAGVDLRMSPTSSIGLSARYEHGLTNIAKDSDEGKLQNRTWSFTGGFALAL